MIDIHSHILPGIDDGAVDMAESLEMARLAIQDGIKTVIATPHIGGRIADRAFIQARVDEFRSALRDAALPLNIEVGGEIPFHFAGTFSEFTLGQGSFLLLELPHTHVPENAGQKIYDLHQQGFNVILAHPERNGDILRNPDLLDAMLDCGAMAQITAGSITGELGSQVQHCAHYLLRQKNIHFIASDSHSSSHRKPSLRKAWKMTGKIIGKKQASLLIEDNPKRVLQPHKES